MKKYFLGFDKSRLSKSFSYITKNSVVSVLKKRGDEVTFNINDDFDEALIGSAEDCVAYYPTLLKRNIPYSILACNDADDFMYMKNDVTLTQNAYNFYKKAARVMIYYESQKEFLAKNKITENIYQIPPSFTFDDDKTVAKAERKAFRSFYQIAPDKKIILSYGSYDNPNLIEIESVARMNPEYQFLFFGKGHKEWISLNLMDRLMKAPNIRYLSVLPEELYHSALLNVSGVLFMENTVSFPCFLFDLIENEVPIISYRNNSLPELINEETALVPKDFMSLYRSITSLHQFDKTKHTKEVLHQQLRAFQLDKASRKD
jgi:glycosyltransferase involved in cell wall biosynthesis